MRVTEVQYPEYRKQGNYKDIWFAGGCFWGTEEYFSLIKGVVSTAVGYANGNIENPTYKMVCTSDTGFAEAVYVQYDPNMLSLKFLLDMYYKTINPHSLNKQGNDIGTQYRTGIYYSDESDQDIISDSLDELRQKLGKPVVVENLPLENFYLAEEEHQEYLKNNPWGYCHIPADLFSKAKKAKDYTKKDKDSLKDELSALQYAVTQENATEPPFNNEYYDEFRKGIYVSITTGEPLFVSTDKFESGCGWPAFSKPISAEMLSEHRDISHGMIRTEVRSAGGDDHLGHVFTDGPSELGGLRYCINSSALRFIPVEKMEEEGYEEYMKLV